MSIHPSRTDAILNSATQSIGAVVPDSPAAMRNGFPLAETFTSSEQSSPAEKWVSIRRMMIAVVIALFGDWSLYQSGGGYSGWAAFVVGISLALAGGIGFRGGCKATLLISVGIVLVAMRLFWQGNILAVIAACGCVLLWTLALHRYELGYRRLAAFVASLVPRAILEIPKFCVAVVRTVPGLGGNRWLTFGIPCLVSSAFAFLFLMANPEASSWFFSKLSELVDCFYVWGQNLEFTELLFWLTVGGISFGLMIPLAVSKQSSAKPLLATQPQGISLLRYRVSRNTLLSVNLLFAGYLIAELISSWGRGFPKGFHYSGYAHQGAAWLTIALVLTTVVLGLIFRARTEVAGLVTNLQRLAVLWIGLNWLLAFAACHRLYVYIEFNGLTRMRIVGILGIACVAVGLFWAKRKISLGETFHWLMLRQLSTFLLFVFIFCLCPTDLIAHRYNVSRILAGHPEPLVQITEQPLSDEAWIYIARLANSSDPLIRDGIRSMLASRTNRHKRRMTTWQHFQVSEWLLQETFLQYSEELQPFIDDRQIREASTQELREFAYQWY